MPHDPTKIYVQIPFSPESLAEIVTEGERHRRNRVQQILFMLDDYKHLKKKEADLQNKQEESKDVLISSLNLDDKHRTHERRHAR